LVARAQAVRSPLFAAQRKFIVRPLIGKGYLGK
jgi:hypothetical protein